MGKQGGAGPPLLVLADTILTEAAPVFAGFEEPAKGRGFLLYELWLVELWTAFAEPAVIESPALTATSKATTKSHGFSGWNSRPPKTAESGAASVVVVFHEYGEKTGRRRSDGATAFSSYPQKSKSPPCRKVRDKGWGTLRVFLWTRRGFDFVSRWSGWVACFLLFPRLLRACTAFLLHSSIY